MHGASSGPACVATTAHRGSAFRRRGCILWHPSSAASDAMSDEAGEANSASVDLDVGDHGGRLPRECGNRKLVELRSDTAQSHWIYQVALHLRSSNMAARVKGN